MRSALRWAGVSARRLRRRVVEARIRQNLWDVVADEVHCGLPLRLRYVGHRQNFSYLCTRVFGAQPVATLPKKVWRWQREPILHSAADLLVVEVGAPGDGWLPQADFYVPFWVDGVVDLDTFAERCRESDNIKEDLRRMRKHRLSYSVTRREEDLLNFYDSMYAPYVLRAHAASAALISRELFASRLDRCELLRVHQGEEEALAGSVVLYREQGPLAWALGVKGADPAYLKMGAGAAVYYFELKHLREQGFKYVALGGSRPFLNDGVVQFKAKWGMQVTAPRPGRYALRYNAASPAVRSFLLHHPFVAEREGMLRGVSFDLEGQGRIANVHYLPAGLAGFDHYTLPPGAS